MASSSAPDYQNYLLPVVIDDIARNDPQRSWASIPIDDDDLSRGYEDITFSTLANAINRLAWIIDSAVGKSTTFETMAYLGASDLRYHIMQMAAIKTGHKVLFSSHLNSLHVHLSLMKQLDCRSLFYSDGTHVDDILAGRSMAHILVPDLDDLIDVDNRAEWYPYTKTYEEAGLDFYLSLHTSGTTGDPKPLLYNHAVTKNHYLSSFIPDVEGRRHNYDLFRMDFGTRVLLPSSPFHVISALFGMCLSVLGRGVLVLPYRNHGISNTDPLFDVCTYSKAKYVFMLPYIMEEIARKPNPENYIKNFEKVFFGGGEVSLFAQKTWAKYTRIINCWGSNEIGLPPQLEPEPEDHEYVYFDMENSGLEFREAKLDDNSDDATAAKVYEMVLTWSPKSAQYSAHFAREDAKLGSGPPYPDYRIGDLWTPHPDPKKSRYVWRFAGRIDDLITLGGAINLHTETIEHALLSHILVKAAIVIGNKRLQPLVVLELVPGTNPEAVNDIWKSVLEPMNAKMQSHARIANTHILVVPAGGLVTTPKGTVSKVKSERKFSKEIEAVYHQFGDVWQDKGRADGITV
ncbi:hypothetical protein E0Z10_g3472 [Xylaria hypoxylon]|uniref:AMP-dependent synthetase/ligase domain-containing protein n=1 Tax=Xylaria hypoxylon TaxID=37992 RepID=A0A4Z0YN08_9PEZI|nr:hypothetical protein E0Z10_g3472 [Xylaria hypoxylon]